MKICLFCFSDSGAKIALKLCDCLSIESDCVHSVQKFALKYNFTAHKSISDDMQSIFSGNDALVFIGACGIAVREIAPYVKSKTSDPAVIVIDDRGRFVIPVLSGHIGGGNELSKKISDILDAVPVVTTATDGVGKFSCDSWATSQNYAISSMKTAKEVSSSILTRDIPICSEKKLPLCLPDGLVSGESGDIGIYVGIYERSSFDTTLRLIPRVVTLGIGCRRGTESGALMEAISSVLKENCIDIRSVSQIASIDIKKDESGLLECAEKLSVNTIFFSAEKLKTVKGRFNESNFVKKTVGIGNVCERAAVLAGGKLIVEKTALNGITIAVAQKDWGIEF